MDKSADIQTYIEVEGHQVGSRQELFPKQQISVPTNWIQNDEPITLQQLIRHLVEDEVAAFEERQAERQVFRVLTASQIEASKPSGRIDPAAKQVRQSITLQSAVRTALQAFEDDLFFVFVDGEQKESLDDQLLLAADSTVRFIRLVALAGG